MIEAWVKCYCSDRHMVSTNGKVKKLAYTTDSGSRYKEGLCKVSKSSGYDRVSILGKSVRVHQLVYFSFNGGDPRETDLVIDHVNGDKSDNTLENLELVTIKENIRRGRGKNKMKMREILLEMYEQLWNADKDKWAWNVILKDTLEKLETKDDTER
jgi:hypothetical protein